ncbi:vWA domain-containing protein [Saccharopolyspora shandongensis]|uniref:vWA domain-containing protein n=1 Tax=Saccharopolyspora shandongensis TaxID=418495 RepID=UPI0033E1C9C4
MADLADLVAAFCVELRAEGLPVGPDRCARFTDAIGVVRPANTRELRWCARATLVSDPDHMPVLDAVFRAVFEGVVDPSEQRGQPGHPPVERAIPPTRPGGLERDSANSGGATRSTADIEVPALASAAEQLSHREFTELSADELRSLAALMRRFALVPPVRRSRRDRRTAHGRRIDLRNTLCAARRTGGHPVRLSRRSPKLRARKLVVLCDISGSMAPFARALLQFLYCAAGGAHAEVFTFATRLTRLTRLFARARACTALARAGDAAPDWSGGTRIADAVGEFLDRHGRRGMARGSVVVIVSDGWETGDPRELGRQMARLARLAFRIIWVNPRVARPGYRPMAGGMAAAWPYCDVVLSGHRLDELDELTAAIADPWRGRRR